MMRSQQDSQLMGPANKPANDRATRTWVLVLTSVAVLMAMLDAMVVATALNAIRTDLHASVGALEWTMNAYSLSVAALLLSGAALGDRFGRRRMFVLGLGLFVAASAACALSRNIEWLIVARIVQGAGAALLTPLAMALLSAAFPPEQRGKALGLFSGITGLALIAGPLLGGAIAGSLAWQWIFWLNIPIGLVLIPLAQRRIPESFGAPTAIDVAGVVLVTGAAVGLVWGLMRGNEAGWSSVEVLAALAAGLAFAAGFIAWELRSAQPMVPMRLFRSRAFSSGIAASFLLYAAMYGVLFFLPQFFQSAQGNGPLGAGLRLLPWTATLFAIAPVAGNLVDRIGERPLMVAGLVLQALGFAWIALIASPDLPYLFLVLPLIVAGAGISMAGPAAQKAVLGAVSNAELGKASGVFNMFRLLGGASGIAIAVAVFAGTGGLGSAQTFSAGFVAAIAVCAVLSLLAAAAGLWQPARRASVPEPAENERRLGW
ncbi:DHA2 family efflux MFS transporter permease subunit [Paraherbaspirillum soli]|uniref:DHA2 family efflux MFS transporter permease subunit n=1 Tax=Paraherbaspirillum soli TaxID=631222 RepID=A0ABW0MF94_9BURK